MLPKLMLSLTSYIPLYILMILIYLNSIYSSQTPKDVREVLLMVILIVIIIQLLAIIYVLKYIKRMLSSSYQANEISFHNVSEDKEAHLTYMFTYMLPLLSFTTGELDLFTIILVNGLILLFIYMNAMAEKFNFNIVLWIKGYRVYTGYNNEEDRKNLLIQKKRFANIRSKQKEYKFVKFASSQDVYICKRYIN